MYDKASPLQWRIIKYKEIKRTKREEYEDVRVVLDEPRRSLSVFCRSEQIEHVYCNMEVSKYPLLRLKSNHFYVLVNSQSQGFRLTFQADDRKQFITIMRKIAFISETPEKNHMNRSFTNTDNWGVEAGRRSTSFSQPASFTHQQLSSVFRSPPKKSAMRNLAKSFKEESQERSYMSPQQVSPVTYYSQPSRSPYSRPLSSASSVSSSISSAMSSLNEEAPFSGFSQNSGNSYMSPRDLEPSKSPFQNSQSSSHRKPFLNSQGSDHRESPSLNPQCSDHPKIPISRFKSTDRLQPSYASLFSPDPLSFSPHTPELLPQAASPKIMITTGVQTDEVLIDQLIKDPQFMKEFLSKMMKNAKCGDLVRAMREQIQKISPETVEEFRKKTDGDVSSQIRDSATSSGPPALVHMNSDMEYDVFI